MPLRPQVRQLQAAGRRGDELLGHLTPGELVLPQSLQSPTVVAAIAQDARRKGINPSSLMAGSKFSSINPATGLPEFADQEGHEQTFQELIAQIVERARAISDEPQLPGTPLPGGPAVPPGTEVPFFFDQVTDFNKFGFGPEAILRDPNLIPGTNVPRGGTTAGPILDLGDFFEVDIGDDGDDDDFGEDGEVGGGKTGTETGTGTGVSGGETPTEGGFSFGGITGRSVGRGIGGAIGSMFGGPLGSAIGSAIGSQIGAAADPLGEFANTFGEIGGPVGPSPRQDFNVAFTGKGAVGSIGDLTGFDPGFGSFEDIGEFGEPGGEAAGGFDSGLGGSAGDFEGVDFGDEEVGGDAPGSGSLGGSAGDFEGVDFGDGEEGEGTTSGGSLGGSAGDFEGVDFDGEEGGEDEGNGEDGAGEEGGGDEDEDEGDDEEEDDDD